MTLFCKKDIIFYMNDTDFLKIFQDWLDSYLNFEKTPKKNIFWLDTMQFFCKKLGHPENSSPCFHVAGSKGKGSVSKMIAAILEEHGKKTGIYTSPHIIDFLERVAGFDTYFDKETYLKAADELMKAVDNTTIDELPGERPITWFELVTMFGFLTFRQAKVDYSIYEVGLGGRLDSTNVVSPLVSCIGPIELEHTEFLGDTIEKIALEKGGIIKENTPVVVAAQKDSVKNVFRKIAQEKNSKIYFTDETSKNLTFSYTPDLKMKVCFESQFFNRPIQTELSMPGEFQAQNAILAAIAVKLALPQIDESTIEKGLSRATLPARFEIIRNPEKYPGIPYLILDGAHTLNSISFTMDTMEALFSKENSPNLLFGCAADKDVDDMAKKFKGKFNECIVTKPGNVKISDLGSMEKAFSSAEIPFTSSEDYAESISKALMSSSSQKRILLVTGSFYLVSEVKKFLIN